MATTRALILFLFSLCACTHAETAPPASTTYAPLQPASAAHDASTASQDAEVLTDSPSSTTTDASLATVPAVAATPAETFRGVAVHELLDAMAHAPVIARHERFSSTTAVYHLELEGGVHIAFKPSVRGYSTPWQHEIMAYRMARLLGLQDRVPPAVARTIPRAVLGRWANADHLARVPNQPDVVLGAAIYWYPVLHTPNVVDDAARARWLPWLRAGRQRWPRGTAQRAEQIATLLLFDYLQANPDRMRPGNVRSDENNNLVYRDNNDGWSLSAMRNVQHSMGRLQWTQRFRRDVIEALQSLDAAQLQREIERDPGPVHPLIDHRVLDAWELRRRHTLRYVRSLIRRYGEAAVWLDAPEKQP